MRLPAFSRYMSATASGLLPVIACNLSTSPSICTVASWMKTAPSRLTVMTVGSFGSLIGGAWVCGNSTGTPTVNSGAVFYLQAPADPTQKWEAIALPHEPTVHRMQWVQVGTKRWDLVVQPLHGRGNKNTVGDGAKVPHLCYAGDAVIDAGANIGAGTITCNYDGAHKHRTVIGDRVRTGSDCVFVAPVTVGDDATTGAGSIITEDVPAEALAIARARQVVKEHYAKRKRDA